MSNNVAGKYFISYVAYKDEFLGVDIFNIECEIMENEITYGLIESIQDDILVKLKQENSRYYGVQIVNYIKIN